jgi:hypothetical protein
MFKLVIVLYYYLECSSHKKFSFYIRYLHRNDVNQTVE